MHVERINRKIVENGSGGSTSRSCQVQIVKSLSAHGLNHVPKAEFCMACCQGYPGRNLDIPVHPDVRLDNGTVPAKVEQFASILETVTESGPVAGEGDFNILPLVELRHREEELLTKLVGIFPVKVHDVGTKYRLTHGHDGWVKAIVDGFRLHPPV